MAAPDSLEFNNVYQENMGSLNHGSIKLSKQSILFKNSSTGKLLTINLDDVNEMDWQKLGNKPGMKLKMADGIHHRFGGMKESDFSKISSYASSKWDKTLQKSELCIKGWNYGETVIDGQNLVFSVDDKLAFEIPLSNVSHCTGVKSEAIIEFHQNEDCPVQLTEMRLHMPNDPEKGEDEDQVEEFRQAVMQFAESETETGQPIVTLPQILCATPRGRYDIKVFASSLSFHGKTYDYKISFKSITRMFLLPHKDGRHMFFVLHLNPPIRQGLSRYPFLVMEFPKDEYIEVELGMTAEQIKSQYAGKLDVNMKGLLYEIMAKLFRVLVNSRIIVPGNFLGASGTPAIACALRQASGLLYPLEKGFVYVHKPPLYLRFEEIDNVHFARSDHSTKSFDFEIVLKSGQSVLFSSVGKEEYNKLFDYATNKGLKIRNANRIDRPNYKDNKFADSDDDEELDPYKEGLKRDVKDRKAGGGTTDSDSEDEDFDVEKEAKKQKEAAKESSGSEEGSDSEPDEEYDSDISGESDVSDDIAGISSKKKKEKSPKKSKKDKSHKDSGKKSKKAKKDKDPNAPKRASSAYFIWLNENRPKIKKDGDSVTDIASRAGRMWKAMSDAEKKPWEKKASADKERYEREMAKYKADKPSSSRPRPASSGSDESDDGGAKSKAKPSSSKSSKSAQTATSSSPQKRVVSQEFVESDSDDSDDSSAAKKKSKDAGKSKGKGPQPAKKSKKASSDEEEEEESDAESTPDSDES